MPSSRSFVLMLGFLLSGILNPSILFAQSTEQKINFHKDIAPIIYQKCTPCHRSGQVGPMPLTNYEEVASYGQMIGYVTKIGYMPPWRAEPSGDTHFLEANHLTELEKQQIQQWIAKDLPEGLLEQAPPLPNFSDLPQIAQPDLVVSMTEAFEQYGVYYDQYRVFAIPTHLLEDKMVSAIEFIPGNSSIVRGAMISLDTQSTKFSALDKWDPQYGYFSFGELGAIPEESKWYEWHPGKKMTVYPQGKGKYLPKDALLLFHIHYGPTGVPQTDSSFINIKFANEKSLNRIFSAPLLHPYNMTNDSFYLPRDEQMRYHAKFEVPFDLDLYSIFPHSHLLGRSWEIFAVSSDRKTSQRLLKITDWDFNWKQAYELEEKISLKKGTTIHALASYDNSSNNLLNPSDPPRPMHWGKRMFEEMFMVYFGLCIPKSKQQKFRLLPGPINVSSTHYSISFKTKKTSRFSCSLKKFSGETVLELFKQKSFKKGKHTIDINLNSLKKGNYFIELNNGNEIEYQILVYVESTLFD